MRTLGQSILLAALTGACALAQQWEVGGMGGAAFLNGVTVTAPAGTATAGFQTGIAAGAFFGQNLYRHLSGEVRYEFLQSNLRLKSGGTEASFSGVSHAVHYDLLWHTARGNSPVQFFAAAGGGLRVFSGTGVEAAYQPLSQYGWFTKTQVLKPLISVGAGLKYRIGGRLYLRTEFRDFITPYPKELMGPPPGTKYGTILHDFIPMAGISYEY